MPRYGISLPLMQLLAYFISEKGYTLIAIQQRPNDLWLVQPRNKQYPILHLCDQDDEQMKEELDMLRQVNRALCDLVHRESKIIVLNVNGNAHSYEDGLIQQIAFQDHIDAAFEHVFPKVQEKLRKVDDEQKEKARLAKQMEETRHKGSLWRERLAMLPRYAFLLLLFVFICTGIAVLSSWWQLSENVSTILLQAFLGQTSLTSLAMILQIPALLAVATLCDGLYHRGTIYIALCSVAIATLFQLVTGASGSGLGALIVGLWCAGIFDVGLVHAYRHPLIQHQLLRQLFWVVIALLVPGNDWIPLFGGLLGGLLGAFCFGAGSFQRNLRRHAWTAIVALLTIISIWMIYTGNEWQDTWRQAHVPASNEPLIQYEKN